MKEKSEYNRSHLEKTIPGWGADLQLENRPGVPKEKAPPYGTGAHWDEPERQKPTGKVNKSLERTDLTPVFGDTCHPKGLSGAIRNYAYNLHESWISHWILLLVADRVDMVESLISDTLKNGVSNPLREMGLGVELKEHRFLQLGKFNKSKVAGVMAVVATGLFAARRLQKKSQTELQRPKMRRAA